MTAPDVSPPQSTISEEFEGIADGSRAGLRQSKDEDLRLKVTRFWCLQKLVRDKNNARYQEWYQECPTPGEACRF